MSNLNRICNEVIEAKKSYEDIYRSSLPRLEWYIQYYDVSLTLDERSVWRYGYRVGYQDSTSANHADRLARALLVMEAALEEVASGVRWVPSTALKREANARREAATEALTQAEKILGGGE